MTATIHYLPSPPPIRAIEPRGNAQVMSFNAYRAARLIERDDPMALFVAAEAIEERVRAIRAILDEQAEAVERLML